MNFMKKQLIIVVAIVLGVGILGYLSFEKKQNTLATIGRHSISVADLEDKIKTYPEQYREQLKLKENKEKILNQMVEEQLLMQAATQEGIDRRDEINKQIEQSKKEIILNTLINEKINTQVTVTEEEVKAFFKQNESQFNEVESRRVQHILVNDEAKALDLQKRAKKGEDFAALAKQYSLDPTGQNGGDLGWFQRGQLVKEFENAAYALKTRGEISGVVRTQFGYHVLRLVDARIRPKLSYDQVKQPLQNQLLANKRQAKSQEYLKTLKEQFKVKVNTKKLEQDQASQKK